MAEWYGRRESCLPQAAKMQERAYAGGLLPSSFIHPGPQLIGWYYSYSLRTFLLG
jgi:hypothetical protein